MKLFSTLFVILFLCLAIFPIDILYADVTITGEFQKWHKVTLTVDGPQSSEKANPNPFLDYRLNATFTNGSQSYTVPGYFAADGDAANTSATSGHKWRVHFSPNAVGTWSYSLSFKSGDDIAVSDAVGTAVAGVDGLTGSFDVADTDKTGNDLRSKGRLEYVGEHYLRFAGNGEWFLKAGPDSPENFLAYEDFDNTPDNGNRRKSWSPHAGDWNAGDPSWKDGKGTEIMGAINYLASRGLNSISFLTMAAPNGDDKNVFPWVSTSNFLQYDCSKLDQWDIVFSHAQKMGMHLHFKTSETENEQQLDGGALGKQRKLYYRELIARFGYHLALNWNIGEENGDYGNDNQTDAERIACIKYFHDNDPYKNNIVIHTAPGGQEKIYRPLLGNKSELTGTSIQTDWKNVHAETKQWLNESAAAGKKWVVANDEQGGHNVGVPHDSYVGSNDKHGIRKNVLWGNLMAGGAGVEYYFGYETIETDLDCQDYRVREMSWRYCNNALIFFNKYLPFWEMTGDDSKTSSGYCLYKENTIYAVYLPSGGTPRVDLGSGTYDVHWYNPMDGGYLIAGNSGIAGGSSVSIGASPNTLHDWVAVVQNANYTHTCNARCTDDLSVIDISILEDYVLLEKTGDIKQLSISIYPTNAHDQSVTWTSGDPNVATVNQSGLVTAVSEGKVYVKVTTTDGGQVDSVGVSVGGIGGNITFGENYLVFEAEATASDLDKWVVRTPDDPKYKKGTRTDDSGNIVGPINDTYIEFTGNNQDGGPPTSPLVYKFTAPKTADYQLTMRILQNLEGAAWDKCNDVYVKLEGNFTPGGTSASMAILTANTKLYGRGKDNWGSMVQLDVNHAKHAARYNLIEGEEYILTISGRAQRTCIDYILFFEKSLNLKMGEEVDIATENPEEYRPQVLECNEVRAVDFDRWTGISGFADAATDNKAGLDILQIGTRDAWAAAEYTYYGATMSAFFRINAMQESDGESTFRVRVNDELIGKATNDRIYGTDIEDYTIQQHKMNLVPYYLEDGDVIRVEFNNATNGLVPEGNLTATSRGRWYSLEICSDNIVREPVSGLEILPATLELSKNNSDTLAVNVLPANAYNKNVTWQSNDASVVTVNSKGVVTGVGNGTTEIIATTVDGGFRASCVVTVVTKALEGIGLDNTSLDIIQDQRVTLTPIFNPVDASNKDVTWESDNPDIVSVNSRGIVKAMTHGTATITVTSDDGGFKATCKVNVANVKIIDLGPIHDAYIESGTAYNNSDLKCEGGRRISYLMFDLAEMPENISAAKLILSVGGDAGDGTIDVKLGNSNNWTESSLSSVNAPSASKVLGSLNQSFSKASSYAWDLNTEFLKGGGKVTLIVTHSGGSDVWFVSKEGSSLKRPKLQLTVPNTEPSSVGNAALPNEFELQIYPNPFNPQTTIAIQNPQGDVDIKIYNALGQQVHAVENYMESKYIWNAVSHSTGLYFVQVSDGKTSKAMTRKVMLVK